MNVTVATVLPCSIERGREDAVVSGCLGCSDHRRFQITARVGKCIDLHCQTPEGARLVKELFPSEAVKRAGTIVTVFACMAHAPILQRLAMHITAGNHNSITQEVVDRALEESSAQ